MLPPSIVVKLAENVRTCRAQLDEAEATAGEIRAEYHGYLELLTYAESQTKQVAPAAEQVWAPGDLVADSPHPAEQASDYGTAPGAWCACGFPGVGGIGIVHGITECTSGTPDPMPKPPAPGSLAAFRRGFFAPHTPANTGTDVPA